MPISESPGPSENDSMFKLYPTGMQYQNAYQLRPQVTDANFNTGFKAHKILQILKCVKAWGLYHLCGLKLILTIPQQLESLQHSRHHCCV